MSGVVRMMLEGVIHILNVNNIPNRQSATTVIKDGSPESITPPETKDQTRDYLEALQLFNIPLRTPRSLDICVPYFPVPALVGNTLEA